MGLFDERNLLEISSPDFPGERLVALKVRPIHHHLENRVRAHIFLPDGHFKFPHLWPVKFPQAGRLNYQLFGLTVSDFLSW
ncbi:MAG: hypothetical protein RL710_1783 [Pseudomonadota bacterium]